MKKYACCTVIFVCSLMLNAFLLGLLISGPHGPMMFGDDHKMHGPGPRLEKAADGLDPASKEKVLALLKKNHDQMDKNRQNMGATFDKMNAILTAPKFDKAKLKALHDSMEKNDAAMKNSMLGMMTAIAEALPDDQRIKFFTEAAPKHPDMGGPDHHDDDDHGPRDSHNDPEEEK